MNVSKIADQTINTRAVLKILGLLAIATLPLAACEPPPARIARDGRPCHQINVVPWEPIWVTADNQTACLR